MGLSTVAYLKVSGDMMNTGQTRRAVVSVYRNDAKVKIPVGSGCRVGGGQRSKVTEFTKASRQNLLFTAFNAKAQFKVFLTLTYPKQFPCDGHTVKAHLNSFLSALRFRIQSEGSEFRYMWALEFQKRGAPHIHLLAEYEIPKKWLSNEWYQVVGSGDEKHLRAGTSIEYCENEKTAGYYMARHYGAKAKQKAVPEGFANVGRFWGASRGLSSPVAVVEMNVGDETTTATIRALRRFTEKELKRNYLAKRVREQKQGITSKGMRPITGETVNFETGEIVTKRRKRPIHRPKRLATLRGAFGVTSQRGFKVINGGRVASQLVGVGVRT